ncbi:hypothetical protein SCLCIDRAFT_1222962 [Scleroderma citrinum Foug A]|uniref:Uncharacterized protein n=1 Tax=Scleroderma citrinum Foug A TaxID=1036808 RepID=A0A0C3DA99_9AGAM|nr:hypothetical protein SCLCIDRAFT_1222962 [Scleroderma citrinum Foug A]
MTALGPIIASSISESRPQENQLKWSLLRDFEETFHSTSEQVFTTGGPTTGCFG